MCYRASRVVAKDQTVLPRPEGQHIRPWPAAAAELAVRLAVRLELTAGLGLTQQKTNPPL